MDRSPYDDEEEDDEEWDDEPDVPWDEPSASEEEEARTDVASTADFLPLLLKAKYGDGWETLLEPYTAEGDEGDEGDEESRSFIELYEHTDEDEDDEDDEPLPSEEVRALRTCSSWPPPSP